MKSYLALALAIAVSGCVVFRTQPSMAVYDFGMYRLAADDAENVAVASGKPRLEASLMVADAAAPAWLDNTGIQYRLAYQDLAQSHAYASSRWAAAPATLLTQQIRSRIAGSSSGGVLSPADHVRADYMLRLELEEFTQVFDTAGESRGVIGLRASLIDRGARSLVAQRSFRVEQAASSADAAGAVHALTEASNRLIGNLIDWLSDKLPADG